MIAWSLNCLLDVLSVIADDKLLTIFLRIFLIFTNLKYELMKPSPKPKINLNN